MPKVIGHYHDGIVRGYLARGKVNWNDTVKSSFGQTLDGFTFRIDVIIKLYPRINGEIRLAGMIGRSFTDVQRQESASNDEALRLTGLDPVRHLLITDRKGYISNVSVGLVNLLGLHPKLFKYSNDSLASMLSIDSIAPSVMDPANFDLIESDGMIVTFDTREILMKVEAETLFQEDLEMIIPNLKRIDLFVRSHKMPVVDHEYAMVFNL